MKPNLKQANARIKEIMQQEGLTFREAQKKYWAAYNQNIGVKVAKLRTQKEKETQKQQRQQQRQTQAQFKRKCHSITGTTPDGYKINIKLTEPRTKKNT